MKQKLEKYLQVLRIELEDIETDLGVMAEVYDQREKRDEITKNVFLENVSVLKSEISGIAFIIRSIEDVHVEQFRDLSAFVEYLDAMFRERTKRSSYPEGVYRMVKRKLTKVRRYIESSE
jgi:hypothetical protein